MAPVIEKLNRRIDQVQSLLCVGLDSDFERLPERFKKESDPQFAFNRFIIDETLPYAAAYKLNTAFYESLGGAGWESMQKTMDFLGKVSPEVFIIMDAKRADIGNTSAQYAKAFFDVLKCDAVTLHPWLGGEALQPFLSRSDKAAIILCHTSNAGAHEMQGLSVKNDKGETLELWRQLARMIARDWNKSGNCMLVVGATVPDVLREVRREVGNMPLLVPGIGAQGGDLKAVLSAGLTADKQGLLINSSRGIIFAENPKKEAENLQQQISVLSNS